MTVVSPRYRRQRLTVPSPRQPGDVQRKGRWGSLGGQGEEWSGIAQISGLLHPPQVGFTQVEEPTASGRSCDDDGTFLRFHLAGEHGGLTCSHLQSYDPDRALTDYISRLEALQRRLGSVTSGNTQRFEGWSFKKMETSASLVYFQAQIQIFKCPMHQNTPGY